MWAGAHTRRPADPNRTRASTLIDASTNPLRTAFNPCVTFTRRRYRPTGSGRRLTAGLVDHTRRPTRTSASSGVRARLLVATLGAPHAGQCSSILACVLPSYIFHIALPAPHATPRPAPRPWLSCVRDRTEPRGKRRCLFVSPHVDIFAFRDVSAFCACITARHSHRAASRARRMHFEGHDRCAHRARLTARCCDPTRPS